MSASEQSAAGAARVRLDKWLWAARFFKTRTLAKQAIESGHVRYDGERCKVSKDVGLGARITVRRGWDEQDVVVRALSDVRRGAPEAQTLYQETDESVQRREQLRLQRHAEQQTAAPDRPTKQQRRLLQKLKRSMFE